jgi:NAD(P)-dependent dehydrogenase (short-subunit alcohol dehydrogenase family)
LTGKTAIVTGANSGIGCSVSRDLAQAGARVVLAVRNPEKRERAAADMPGATEVRELDLGSLNSVRAFAAAWEGPIDLLINNAGVSAPSLARTANGFESDFGINHLGHFALTNLLLDNITSRVVTVTSQAERLAGSTSRTPTGNTVPSTPDAHITTRSSRTYCSPPDCSAGWPRPARQCCQTPRTPASFRQTSTTATAVASPYGNSSSRCWRRTRITAPYRCSTPPSPRSLATASPAPDISRTCVAPPEIIDRSATANNPQLADRLWTVSEDLAGIRSPI